MACAVYEVLPSIHGYDSGLVDASPASPDVELSSNSPRPMNANEGIEQPEWISLYKRDKSFADFVRDVLSLFQEDEETAPELAVVNWVFQSSVLSKKLLAQNWKAPRVSTDDSGGLRLSWRLGSREVRAVVPADLSARYLYWQKGNEYGGEPNFGSGTLYARLHWLNGRDRQ